jgi:hypothetical protein
MSAAENTKNRQKTTFSNSDYISFDKFFSALSFVFANGGAICRLIPINKEMVGKTPKKGDNIFDYESRVNYGISAEEATALLEGLELLENQEDAKSFSFSPSNAKNGKTITIYAPNTISLNKIKHDDFVIKFERKKEDESVEKFFHVFNHSEYKYTNLANEEATYRLEHDISIFKKFLENVITNSIGIPGHIARQTVEQMGTGKRGGNSGGSSGQQVEEDDGTTAEAVATTKSSLESEFDDQAAD